MLKFVVTQAVLAVLAVGCDDGDCIDGVCTDFNQARTFPGPCRSAGADTRNSSASRVYSYDDEGRIALVTSEGISTNVISGNEYSDRIARETRWTYDPAGAVSGVETLAYTLPDRASRGTVTWQFDPSLVTRTGDFRHVYDRSLFSFLPLVGLALQSPSAELGLVEYTGKYQWTVVDARLWIQSVVGGSRTWRYEFDDRGRLVRRTTEPPADVGTWIYDGDLLVQGPSSTYRYDRGGNVVEQRGAEWREVFGYDCW